MCVACSVPAAVHEDVLSSVANGAILLSPLLLAKARLLARIPGRLVDSIAEAIIRM